MDPNTFPTKGNLILAKNSLALSRQGYELMDKKRNVLLKESEYGDGYRVCGSDFPYGAGGEFYSY